MKFYFYLLYLNKKNYFLIYEIRLKLYFILINEI